MFKKLSIWVLSVLLMMGSAVSAQEQDYPEGAFILGVASNISSNSLTLKDIEEDLTVTVSVDNQTIFENISSLNDIAEGDEVYVDYVVKENTNIAINVFKIMEDEYIDEESYEAQQYGEDSYIEGYAYDDISQEQNNESEE